MPSGQAFLNAESARDRYTTLISLCCTPDNKSDLERALIAYRLAATTAELPITHSRVNPFSSEILSSHHQVVQLIQSLLESPATGEGSSSEPGPEPHPNVTVGNDTCDLCDAPIPFTDLKMAACMNGHQFPRCGLTFLAIQAPRITKSCGICDTVFLSDEFVKAQEGVKQGKSGTDGRQNGDAMQVDGEEAIPTNEEAEGHPGTSVQGGVSSVSLARILFLACDVCIYCGGKFVG